MRVVFALFLASFLACSPFTARRCAFRYYGLDTSYRAPGTFPNTLVEVVASEGIDTSRILYRKDGYYAYYSCSRWLSSPPRMVERSLVEAFGFRKGIAPQGRYLRVELLSFHPVFDGSPYFFFEARCTLYGPGLRSVASRVFSCKRPFEALDVSQVAGAAAFCVQEFERQLYLWLSSL